MYPCRIWHAPGIVHNVSRLLPEVPPPSFVAQYKALQRHDVTDAPDHYRTVAVVATLVIGMAPGETLLELLSAPQPGLKEIGGRRIATVGDATSRRA